jgi:pimeloyl-ACP methyl ester carboxylesterase
MPSVSLPPVLLLHGAWHGSWCWEPVAAVLTAAGHPVLAIDLPGHGLDASLPDGYLAQDLAVLARASSPIGRLSAVDISEAAVRLVRALHAAFGPVVVVAHSAAGVTLNHVGEAVPELLHRMVYLAALAPTPGRTVFDQFSAPEFAGSLVSGLMVADPAATGALRINWHSADAEYRSTARQCFYADVPDALADAAIRQLTPDSPVRVYSDAVPLTAEKWGSVPRTWIRCTQDRAVPIAAQDANIALLDAAFPRHSFDKITLDTSHSPFLSASEQLAAGLVEAAKG